jgi:fructosamine-3-kinase
MKQDIKTQLTQADIQRVVEASFGAGSRVGGITELTGGLFNNAYAIHLPDQNIDTVLRVAPSGGMPLLTYEKHLMRTEVACCQLLRQRTTIPLPELYHYDFSGGVIPMDYMFTSKLKGVPLREVESALPGEVCQSLAYELGQYAAQIHAVKGDRFGYFGDAVDDTWRAAFLRMLANLLNDAAAFGVSLPRPPADIQRIIEQNAATLDDIREPRLLHGDLWDANVFVVQRDGAWTIEAIIDCDRAIWGDPDMEYSLMFRDHQPRFFEGYGRTLSDAPDARLRRQLYLAYLYLLITVEVSGHIQAVDRLNWAVQQLTDTLDALERRA